MRFSILSSIAALSVSTLAFAQITPPIYEETSFSSKYTDTDASVDILTCGSQLAAEGYTTVGAIPGNIAGFANITSTDSSLCGQCYTLEYAGAFLTIRVVDTAETGFVTTKGAYETLTGNQTPIPPSVDARVLEGPTSC
ncbi:uncharacterized protein B0H18DRAFT_1046061 [Fomitopsis serialis]|uniref:uncharacterized protein n=1 Tax=Fomitopsis serialis TaxID=139415 RepID=UPI0020081EF2|nr:uncharacterized protein B0H18DRAFT_1069243 [Neoantrodia serialis]XP_047886484.1 uncharacterized protein B0H18DRAFT_1046061 [Neoantrodia serialis]KAH9910483.1 hypothetical protein B0H18DRAFT_1069243 [Neoantrodia serialis]KAH9914303.1 hypothetical protein B0H18DRAFT_1046061 [Neoantrodia serialis]